MSSRVIVYRYRIGCSGNQLTVFYNYASKRASTSLNILTGEVACHLHKTLILIRNHVYPVNYSS